MERKTVDYFQRVYEYPKHEVCKSILLLAGRGHRK